MKSRNHLCIAIAAVAFVLISCEKTYEDLSKITFFPEFTMEGEAEIIHPLGEPYEDGAVTATEAGNSLEVDMVVTGVWKGYSGSTVDVNEYDKYEIIYSATNAEGFEGNVIRTVFVAPPTGDLVSSLEGVYLSQVQRTPAFAVLPQYSDMKYIYIWKTGDNTFELSCALGAYYFIGRDYGLDFAFQGAVITANDIPANDFSISQATSPGFGNVADITDFIVDPVNRVISFTSTADFANGIFHIQLEQVQY
jgi:hypothetical protein